MSNHRPIAHVRRDLDEVQKLLASRGWAVIHEFLARDVEAATLALATKPSMEQGEVHFRRGALSAALNMTRLPDAVLIRIENELALHPDAAPKAGSKPPSPKTPAKAGNTG